MPLTEIALESRHTRESHKMNYRIAKKLAKLIGGVIYDHQVDVVYGSSGRPCDHYRTDEKFEKYGAGTNLFMGAIGMVEGILKSK